MDQVNLRRATETLEKVLKAYAETDEEAESLYVALRPLISDALSGRVIEPLETGQVPGSYFFNEGHLRKYRNLEQAYSQFVVELTGGEDSVIMQVARQIATGN